MNKAEFLETLRAERARLEAALAKLSEAELSQPGPDGGWSVKDNLAHLVFWEQYMLEKVRRALVGESPRWVTNEEETQMNAEIYEHNRERTLAEVLADMHRSYADVVEQVQSMSEADLTDPERFPWMKGKPIWTYIAAEAYGEHYHEHLGRLLGGTPPAGA